MKNVLAVEFVIWINNCLNKTIISSTVRNFKMHCAVSIFWKRYSILFLKPLEKKIRTSHAMKIVFHFHTVWMDKYEIYAMLPGKCFV